MIKVILTDINDNDCGEMEKMEAHSKGMLHRAFSVFVFNRTGELLMQQRSFEKYHSAGLWSNTCCGHPQPGETVKSAAKQRLNDEMGFTCELTYHNKFIYKAALENNLTEYELDYIFTANYDNVPNPDPAEVMAWRWIGIEKLISEMQQVPEKYSYWFKEIVRNYF